MSDEKVLVIANEQQLALMAAMDLAELREYAEEKAVSVMDEEIRELKLKEADIYDQQRKIEAAMDMLAGHEIKYRKRVLKSEDPDDFPSPCYLPRERKWNKSDLKRVAKAHR